MLGEDRPCTHTVTPGPSQHTAKLKPYTWPQVNQRLVPESHVPEKESPPLLHTGFSDDTRKQRRDRVEGKKSGLCSQTAWL